MPSVARAPPPAASDPARTRPRALVTRVLKTFQQKIWTSRNYSDQRRKSKAPLVPPKPNELDMAYSKSAFLGWLGT